MAKRTKEGFWDRFSRTGVILVLLYVLLLIIGFSIRLIFFSDSSDSSIIPDSTVVSAEGTEASVTKLASETACTANENILSLSFETNFYAVLEGKQFTIPVNMSTTGQATLDDLIWTSSDESIATVHNDGTITGVSAGKCTITVCVAGNDSIAASVPVTVRSLEQIDGCTYIDGILVANKTYALAADYNPGLEGYVLDAFEEMKADAAEDGMTLYIGSDFRDYSYQEEVYTQYANQYGWELADTFSARPGHSEHQTGLTIDCNSIDDAFGETEESIWLAEHCANYGFIIRFPEGAEEITGYKYEPWHIRYVGVETAQEITELGITLEEYLGINSEYVTAWGE